MRLEPIHKSSQAKKNFSKVVLEVGFGNGENTLALARQNPRYSYI